jgi:hypothetical protein
MPTERILALLVEERDKLSRAIEALQGGVKRRGRPPKNPLAVTTSASAAAPKKHGRRFSAAQRKAASERMRQRWALKRKASDADQPHQLSFAEAPIAFDAPPVGQAEREARSGFTCCHFDFYQPRWARLRAPPVIERRDRNVVALAKLPPRQPAALELLDHPPDVIGTPLLLAHAAIFRSSLLNTSFSRSPPRRSPAFSPSRTIWNSPNLSSRCESVFERPSMAARISSGVAARSSGTFLAVLSPIGRGSLPINCTDPGLPLSPAPLGASIDTKVQKDFSPLVSMGPRFRAVVSGRGCR